jgi:phage terminase large subunit
VPNESTTYVRKPNVGPPLFVTYNGKRYDIGLPPSLRQWEFLNRGEMEQLYGGSKSSGKSRGLCAKIIAVATSIPGNRIGLFRKDLTDLKGSTLVTFDQMCPRDLIIRHHKTDHIYTIRTSDPKYPTEIIYGGLGDIHEVESAKGKEFGCIAIDEPSEIEMETYLQLLAQLRWVLPNGQRPPYQAWLGTNPEPGWLENHFGHLIREANPNRPVVSDGSRVYIMALPKDNPYLPPNWEAVLRNQKDIPQTWVKKYLEGSWEASEGQVFKEFDRDIHLIQTPPPDYLKRLNLIASVDHATTGITCMVIGGVDPSGNIIVLGSYYAANKLISEHAGGMKLLLDEWVDRCGKRELAKQRGLSDKSMHEAVHGVEYILIDPSTQAKTMQNRTEMWSVQDEYRRHGIPTVEAWNALETGINLLREYLHPKSTHIHPITGLRGAPSIFIIHDSNRDGIKELVSWRKTITSNGGYKYVGKDHWIDNVRYIAMSRPAPPQFTAQDVISMDSFAQKAHKAHESWATKWGRNPEENQWFGGGTGPNENTWFKPEKIQ